uniref:Mu transposase domain-containing protein n=1 Tax=Halalkalibacterium ligniniphilum TaxID=1134413 RepID=UPI00047555F3|nr:hypothetical protein [Halalkalibacterium ligniniphilum]
MNSLALVNFETNAYSVPTRYAGRKEAEIHAYVSHIEITIYGECVAKHERSYEKFQEVFEVDHMNWRKSQEPFSMRVPMSR